MNRKIGSDEAVFGDRQSRTVPSAASSKIQQRLRELVVGDARDAAAATPLTRAILFDT